MRLRNYSIFCPTERAARRPSNVVLVNILSFMWESTWICRRLEGICWATWIKYPNLPKILNHLGNISSGFLQSLKFLVSLENLWTFFHVARDFGQQWNLFLTSIVYPNSELESFKFPNCLILFIYYFLGDHWDFSKVPNISGSKIEIF